ncbi:MAG TPA: PAS domain S-box protein, partial [Candidatus Binatia bacterium]|nr:PAS domain S-box protein [Candidatus Binatia bacterium]
KRAEAALRESEERYRNLFENANDALATVTLDGTFTAVNRAAEQLFGWSRAELIGQHASVVATPASVALAEERTRRFLAGERLPSSTFEAELIRKDGCLMVVEARTRTIRNAAGEPVGFQGSYCDVTERKRMEKALQESEEKYRTIFAASPDFVYLTDTEGNLLDANPALLERAGLALEQLRQKNVRDFYAGGKPEELEQLLAELRSGHTMKGVEIKARNLAGEVWDYEIHAIPLGNHGEVSAVLSVARDITERKRMEAALRESEQRYRAVVETQTEMVCRFRPDTTLTFVNEAYCRYFGKSREELLGTSFLSLIPEPARPVAKAHIDSLIAQPRLVIDEHEVIGAGGEIRWQQWMDQTIFDDRGRLTGFQSTGRDITERKRAEEALQKSEQHAYLQFQQLQAIYHTAPVGLCVLSADLRFLKINERLAEMIGLARPGYIGRTAREVLPTLADKLEPICRQAMKTGRPALDVEIGGITIVPPRGERVWHVSSFPLGHTAGAVSGVNVVVLDITERKRAEEALQRAQAELARVTRVTTLGEMAVSIAHEVNQPLGAIVGNADLCLRWLARETPDLVQVRDALCDIITDGHRASAVVGRIRALTKKENSPKTRCDMNEIIRETVALAVYEMRRKRITLRTELAPDLPPVFGDSVQLGQVMLNLIMNGIEAMSEVRRRARELVIRTERNDTDEVLTTVQDCGVGVDPQEVKRIFTPFYTTKPEGIGIGLAICRSIVETHGGRLWAVPNPGPGATLRFTVPSGGEER